MVENFIVRVLKPGPGWGLELKSGTHAARPEVATHVQSTNSRLESTSGARGASRKIVLD